MGKTLITKKNIHDYVDQGRHCLVVGSDKILTPGAKDEAREKNYQILYEEEKGSQEPKKIDRREENPTAKENGLEEKIRTILVRDYGVCDENLIRNLTNKIVEQASS